MKKKNIKSVIHGKVNAWIKSVQDEELRKELQENIVVTGGCIASMLLGEDINDYDVYFRTYDSALKCAKYYIGIFNANNSAKHGEDGKQVKVFLDHDRDAGRIKIVVKSAGVATEGQTTGYAYFEDPGIPDSASDEYIDKIMKAAQNTESDDKNKYRPVFLTDNAITLSDKIQLVIRFQGEPDEIHENYDFVHCMNYWSSWDNNLVLRQEALESLLAKDLQYHGSKYPICSMFRTRKFIQRGWTVNAGQILKMAMQISELDLTDLDVLEDQLVGVDTAYFVQLLSLIKADRQTNPDMTIDHCYVAKLIDKLF